MSCSTNANPCSIYLESSSSSSMFLPRVPSCWLLKIHNITYEPCCRVSLENIYSSSSFFCFFCCCSFHQWHRSLHLPDYGLFHSIRSHVSIVGNSSRHPFLESLPGVLLLSCMKPECGYGFKQELKCGSLACLFHVSVEFITRNLSRISRLLSSYGSTWFNKWTIGVY